MTPGMMRSVTGAATRTPPPLVEDVHHVAMVDAVLLGVLGMDPGRLVGVSIQPHHLARLYLPEPLHVVVLAVHPPTGMVGTTAGR